jgi:hypothetical protein
MYQAKPKSFSVLSTFDGWFMSAVWLALGTVPAANARVGGAAISNLQKPGESSQGSRTTMRRGQAPTELPNNRFTIRGAAEKHASREMAK